MALPRISDELRLYRKADYRACIAILLIVVVVAVMAVISLSINSYKVTFSEVIEVIINRINNNIPDRMVDFQAYMRDYVVIECNLARTIASICVGTVLAVCGVIMQTITRNPLAEPYTIGISSAALLGVVLCILFGWSLIPGLDSDVAIIVNAFCFSMIPCAVIIFLSSFRKMSPNMMILIGIGMMYMASSITTFLKFNASDEKLEEIYRWSVGSLSNVCLDNLYYLIPATIIVLIFFILFSKKVIVLQSGDNVAHSLGVNPFVTRVVCFIGVSIGVAVCVCYTGTIGFVGLVAPHLARLVAGNRLKILIPLSGVIGAFLVLFGDIAVRYLPGGLPAGVITALVGSPIFLYFLYKQRSSNTF